MESFPPKKGHPTEIVGSTTLQLAKLLYLPEVVTAPNVVHMSARCCRALHDPHPRSYHERALGTLQAMVELNIRSSGSTVSMEELEDFWDSEAPRIGDAHPSLAGISPWRDTSTPARVEPTRTVVESGRPKSVRLFFCVFCFFLRS